MSVYYRRNTRMHFFPALRYFTKYGVLGQQYDMFRPITEWSLIDTEEPYIWQKKKKETKMGLLDDKLLDNLFRKYPDLKYETLSRSSTSKGLPDHNTFSYAFHFIETQKNFMQRGYTQEKSFELAEEKFQSHLNRKLDQTLLARGLAIGNRARSFLTVYQQQTEFESRLKAERAKRQLKKYEEKVKEVQQALQKEKRRQEQEEMDKQDEQMYARTLYKVTPSELYPENRKIVDEDYKEETRAEIVDEFDRNVKSVFKQFYEVAAAKDNLEGLHDKQILQQILDSPGKIKRRLSKLLKKLHKHGVELTPMGDIDFSKVDNERIRQALQKNPLIKMALMVEKLDFELPHRIHMKEQAKKLQAKIKQLEEEQKEYELTREEKDRMLKNKKVAFKPFYSEQLRQDQATYKVFESYEQRLLRIEIKWLRQQLADLEGDVNSEGAEEKSKKLTETIDRLRRAKYRLEQKNLEQVYDDTEVFFSQHKQLDKDIMIDSRVEYEDLLYYLRKRVEDRRLNNYDEINDDKITRMIKRVPIDEQPRAQGEQRVDGREPEKPFSQKRRLGLE